MYFATLSSGIVAKCGKTQNILHLPDSQVVGGDRLKRRFPRIARFWNLTDEVLNRAFDYDVFHGTSEDKDIELQRAAEYLVQELRSGRFDAGLALDCAEPPCKARSFRDELCRL